MARYTPYRDRADAGQRLADAVIDAGLEIDVVAGLPRGGLPVAAPVAALLDVPLDVLVVRKLGVPHHPELAMGAIGEGGVEVLDDSLRRRAGVSDDAVDAVRTREREVLDERFAGYRRVRPAVPLDGARVLIVDDGVATGATMLAAIDIARARHAGRVIVGVPVASPRAAAELEERADGAIILTTPHGFMAVGEAYVSFGQTDDEEVRRLLEQAAATDLERPGHPGR